MSTESCTSATRTVPDNDPASVRWHRREAPRTGRCSRTCLSEIQVGLIHLSLFAHLWISQVRDQKKSYGAFFSKMRGVWTTYYKICVCTAIWFDSKSNWCDKHVHTYVNVHIFLCICIYACVNHNCIRKMNPQTLIEPPRMSRCSRTCPPEIRSDLSFDMILSFYVHYLHIFLTDMIYFYDLHIYE